MPPESPPLSVLFEDNHLLVVNKPAMLPTMGVSADKESLLSRAKQYIRQKYDKPGNVYLGVVSRLDAPVSGVVLVARTSKAAARLTQQFRQREVEKTYWALVRRTIRPDHAELVDFVRKDERHRRMHIALPEHPEAKEARLSYRVCERIGREALLEVRLETGRKHQIRVQLAELGCPILGDRKYGSSQAFPSGIALHSHRLVIEHPVRKEPMEFLAPLPESWKAWEISDR